MQRSISWSENHISPSRGVGGGSLQKMLFSPLPAERIPKFHVFCLYFSDLHTFLPYTIHVLLSFPVIFHKSSLCVSLFHVYSPQVASADVSSHGGGWWVLFKWQAPDFIIISFLWSKFLLIHWLLLSPTEPRRRRRSGGGPGGVAPKRVRRRPAGSSEPYLPHQSYNHRVYKLL